MFSEKLAEQWAFFSVGPFHLWHLAIIIILSVLLIQYLRKTHGTFESQSIPVVRVPKIFAGTQYLETKDNLLTEMNEFRKHDRLYGEYYGRIPVLVVGKPEYIKIIVDDEPEYYRNRQLSQLMNLRAGSSSLFLPAATGLQHKICLKYIKCNYESQNIAQIIPFIDDCAKELAVDLLKMCNPELDLPIDFYKWFTCLSLDMIAYTLFETNMNCRKERVHPLAFHIPAFSDWMSERIHWTEDWIQACMKNCFYPEESVEYLRNFLEELVFQRRHRTGYEAADFINLYVDGLYGGGTDRSACNATARPPDSVIRTGMTDELVALHLMLHIFMTFRPISLTLTYTLYMLARYPQIQDLVAMDIDTSLDRKENYINAKSLARMHYTDMVIFEVLRLFPPFTRIEYTALQDVTILDKTLPQGSIVVFPVYCMQRYSEYFPIPDDFLPERFENLEEFQKSFTYLPFGAGTKKCLGIVYSMWIIKTVLTHLLQEFEFLLDEQAPCLTFNTQSLFLLPQSCVNLLVKKRRYPGLFGKITPNRLFEAQLRYLRKRKEEEISQKLPDTDTVMQTKEELEKLEREKVKLRRKLDKLKRKEKQKKEAEERKALDEKNYAMIQEVIFKQLDRWWKEQDEKKRLEEQKKPKVKQAKQEKTEETQEKPEETQGKSEEGAKSEEKPPEEATPKA